MAKEVSGKTVSKHLLHRMEEENDIKLAYKIAEFLESRSIKYTATELETIVRLYRASKLLGGRIDLNTIIIAVISKDPFSEKILRRKLSSARQTMYIDERTVGKKPERRKHSKGKRDALDKKRSIDEKEKTELIHYVQKYLETRNLGYLDLLEEKLRTMTKKKGGTSSDGKGLRSKAHVFEARLKRLIDNPNDRRALVGLSRLEGGVLAPYIIKFELEDLRGRQSTKNLQFIVRSKPVVVNRNVGLSKEFVRDSKSRSRNINVRKSVFNFARIRLNQLVFRKKYGSSEILFVIDRSDSMKKYEINLIEILMSLQDVTGKTILFSETPRMLSTRKVLTSPKILKQVLEEGFSGYTDIINALRLARRFSHGRTIVLISDLEQTVKTKGDLVTELLKTAVVSKKMIVFTTKKGGEMLRSLIAYEKPGVLRKITILEGLSTKNT